MSTGDCRISEPSTVLVMMIVVIFKTCQKERIRRPKGFVGLGFCRFFFSRFLPVIWSAEFRNDQAPVS